ncbi:hypothetical protein NCCP2165_19500 [Halomonas sp. NCCP-2165]|nr:hypothetical protein NCCP2165_19500 [Halomonas sp. NCCP-2165]
MENLRKSSPKAEKRTPLSRTLIIKPKKLKPSSSSILFRLTAEAEPNLTGSIKKKNLWKIDPENTRKRIEKENKKTNFLSFESKDHFMENKKINTKPRKQPVLRNE